MTDIDPNSPNLRIACYGFAEPSAGSVSSAGFSVLRQLLDRGHRIDFFNKTSFVRPRELESHPNYRFIDVPNPRSDRFARQCSRAGSITRHLGGQIAHRIFSRGILGEMQKQHFEQPYDVQLWLGDWAWGRIPGVPVISWVQGPPETDSRSIVRRKKELLDLCGNKQYLPLRAYAAYRATLGLPNFHGSDKLIVGSAWSKQRLATYGVPAKKIHVLPYPVDLQKFSPGSEAAAQTNPPLVLWLGRTVPRKRLDLFLDACDLLLRRGQDLRIMVVGGFDFVPEYRRLIDRFPRPRKLQYFERFDRDAVVDLLRGAAILVQPSEDENFGSAIAESLACGTPVVVGPTNGTADYIAGAGVRFDHYDALSVANAIDRALSDAHHLRPLARPAAERFFDVQAITDNLISILYGAAVNKSSTPRTPLLQETDTEVSAAMGA